jgi:hypothetical protein
MREATQEELDSVNRYINSISKPTGVNFFDLIEESNYKRNTSPCDKCSSNPKNGGSGICHCTLGQPQITC